MTAEQNPIQAMARFGKRSGRCFELGYRALERCEGWVLVHGEVMGPLGSPMTHAWLEADDRAYDPVLHVVMARAEYGERFAAREFGRWNTFVDAQMEVARCGHYGPWASE